MNPAMGLLEGDTTRSSTHGTDQSEKDSETGYDRCTRESVRLNIRESWFTARQPTMPWPQGCSLTKSPHLPKDNEDVNAQVKRLQAMLDATTVVDPAHDREDGDQDHEVDQRQSPRGDSTSSITPPEERVRGCGRDNHNLHNVIHDRDACGRIENRHRDRERDEQEQRVERDYVFMALSMTNLTGTTPQKEGTFHEVSRLIPET
jgi:hypothetical protein